MGILTFSEEAEIILESENECKENNGREVPEGESKDVPEGVSKDVPEGHSKDVPEGDSKDVPEGDSKDVPEGDSKDVPEGDSKDYSKDTRTKRPPGLNLHGISPKTNNTIYKKGQRGLIQGSPTDVSPTKIVRSELLQNVKLDVYLKINKSLPNRVLCIDGGGVKGIVEAVILKYLHYCLQRHHAGEGEDVLQDLKAMIQHDVAIFENESNSDEYVLIDIDDRETMNSSTLENVKQYSCSDEPHIHKMFDIVAGTSTGSIIATAISRLHWNPQQLIDTSKLIAPIIFPKPSRWNLYAKLKSSISSGVSLLSNSINKYSVKPLEDYLENTIGNVTWEGNHDNGDGAAPVKPILGIITIRADNAQVKIFNSVNYKDSKTVTIQDAIRASTAAPTYFPSHHIVDDIYKTKDESSEMESFAYVDGGLSANCPANYTMGLLEGPDYELACLISIGCGDDTPTYLPLARVVQMAMNNEESWNSFYKSHPRDQPSLYRITPSKQSGIGSYDLADSDKVDEMEEKFIKSLHRKESEKCLNEMVQATTCLFAKSLRITEASLRYEKEIKMYLFRIVLEIRYNGKKYECRGETLKEPKVLSIKRDDGEDDALKPIHILAMLDDNEDTMKFEYQGYEICGSPIFISRKLTMYEEDEIETANIFPIVE